MISAVNIGHIQLILDIYLSGNEHYNFSNIEEFKNEVHTNDTIESVTLIVLCGIDIDDVYSIGLSSIISYSTISFSSSNKSWVDDTAYKYKKYLNNLGVIEIEKSIEETAVTTENATQVSAKDSWFKIHENLAIGIVSIVVTIIIAILGWTKFKK
ncbi:hypothetical protein [Clostridium akagii]|uniref:hypothetical protein n=1 Tax=Clostridium akagii TaxID=91623 RepID=UPI00047BB9D9|nr:hypothetical protein [Clostridium akagii]